MANTAALAHQNTASFAPELKLIEGGLLHGGKRAAKAPALPQVRVSQKAVPESSKASAVVVILLAALISCGLALASSRIESARAASMEAFMGELPRVEIVVHAGDTLWDIAKAQSIEGVSTARVVDVIQEENALGAEPIQPGQHLIVPAAG